MTRNDKTYTRFDPKPGIESETPPGAADTAMAGSGVEIAVAPPADDAPESKGQIAVPETGVEVKAVVTQPLDGVLQPGNLSSELLVDAAFNATQGSSYASGNKIVVMPSAGLGNRLHQIVSGVVFGQTQRPSSVSHMS